jgi:tetratricopeptide (TPR) repeat protein
MSQSEDRKPNHAEHALRAIERFWQARLPDSFRRLYECYEHPFVAPCEFLDADAIAQGAGREFGMLPQFLSFGRAVGDGGVFGFYVTRDTALGHWPVLYWDEDEMYLRPVASDFAAFLRYCVLVGRYETEEQWQEGNLDEGEEQERRDLLLCLGLPTAVAVSPLPRNDTELYASLVSSDPQDATSLCHLGCVQRARGSAERALDFFHRAGEAAPWFGDPFYLMADVYRERGDIARATESWWSVARRLLPLCTRTWEWDLGEEHPEADIYEVAADGLAQYADQANADLKTQALWQIVVHDDPYDPEARETLGNALAARGDLMGAEHEYLNALSLCSGERGKQPDRIYEALIALYERTGRPRDAALARHDRALPRPSV